MRASGAGKRFRPFLVVESAALFGVPRQQALMAGAALECVHCYSLVHDDLPAMDNDALRRGQPTVHKAFDEATAILAGDGLLTFAFDILSRPETHPRSGGADRAGDGAGARLRARRHGGRPDARSRGRGPLRRRQGAASSARPRCVTLQAMKTGALLRFGCRSGGILGEATRRKRAALERYGVGGRPRVPDRRRSARCRGRSGAGRQSRPARMRSPARPPWSACWARRAPRRGSRQLVAEAEPALAPFGGGRNPDRGRALRRRTCCA